MKKNKIAHVLLALLFIFSSLCFMKPEGSEAMASGTNNAFYVETSLDISDYKKLNDDGTITSTVPKATDQYADWIFAGWYTDTDCTSAVGKKTVDGTAYAKFVPAEVLSIKCQTNANLASTDDTAKIRIISTVDSLKYSQVGFDLQFKGKELSYQTSTVLSGIQAAKDGVEYGFSPNIFDLQSKYFITATIVNIPNKDFDEGLLMKPYWVTKDGTKVYGVERYARVEDSYLHIVNVPVRLVSDNVQATAGTVTVTYDNANLKFEQTYIGTIKDDVSTTTPGFVAGGAFTVEAAAGTGGTVTVTGSADTMQSTDGMFAHLRFKALDAKGVLPKTNIFKVDAAFTDAEEATVAGVTTVNSVYKYYNTAKTSKTDKDWFNGEHVKPGTTEFVITSPDELYGLAELVNAGTITTEKIYLGADITVNTGTIVSKADNGTITINKTYDWTPIGAQASGKKFAGTFDGQGHTISGLHTNVSTAASNKMYAGLFGTIETTSKVKNFRIGNSYFKAEHYAGSVAGCLASGTIENVYSEAYVETSQTGAGGIVGYANSSAVVYIKDCWFKGNATAGTLVCGGIVGTSGGTQPRYITNCLNEGTIKGTEWVGGLVGNVIAGEMHITDCLNVGTVQGNKAIGSAVGRNNATCNIEDVYALGSTSIGTGSVTGTISTFTDANKSTYYGYKALDVLRNKWDFDNTWVVRANNTPVLKAWCESGALYTPATSWAGGTGTEKDPYIIKTASQLYKLANDVNNGTTYDNTFFKLGANITINSGNASRWEESAPKYNWTPIGKKDSKHFKGSFNGANYTIKGLYIVDTSTSVGLFVDPDEVVIENLKVTNSYLKGGVGTAAIVGWYGGGLFDTLYSDAIVVANGDHGAGIVSLINQEETKVNQCWFDGTLSTTGSFSGGILSCNTKDIEVTNCLNTGSVTSTGSTGQVGGIIGRAAGPVKMSDCLNTGTITGVKNTASVIGFNNYVSIKVERVFVLESSHELTCSNDDNVKAKITKVADVAGANGYLNTYLTFDRPELPVPTTGEWVARKNNVPALKSLVSASDILPLDGNNMYRADTRWYDKNPSATTYTIKTAEELVGLAELVNGGEDFASTTIYLADDITINKTNGSDWYTGENAGKLFNWTPIGTSQHRFKGKFITSGEIHTISGLYATKSVDTSQSYWYVSLFGYTDSAEVKNIKVQDSYFSGQNYIGGIVGTAVSSTIDTVYSNAIIQPTAGSSGGIAGHLSNGTIRNGWFGGQIIVPNQIVGGIAGLGNGSGIGANIVDCLVTGEIIANKASGEVYAGGILGIVNNGSAKITNCMSAPKEFTTKTGVTNVDPIIGGGSSRTTISGAYAVNSSNANEYKGAKGYQNTYLAFDRPELPVQTTGAWVARKSDVPGLKSFVNESDILTLDGDNMYRADKRWSDTPVEDESGVTTYTITTAEELIGLAELVNGGNDFASSIIYLAEDITINKTNGADWYTGENTSKLFHWTPIGTNQNRFKGKFITNGEIRTISGLYVTKSVDNPNDQSSWYIGLFGFIDSSEVKNVKVQNSYFSGTYYVGGVVGAAASSTIETVYSNAIIESASGNSGGIVGYLNNGTVNKGWFAGSITTPAMYVGGIVGLGNGSSTGANINNCLTTGKIISKKASGDISTGGIFGGCNQAAHSVSIANCLSAPEEFTSQTGVTNVGYIVGKTTSKTSANNCYSTDGTTQYDNYKGYMNTNLDFDNTWVAMENSAPVLQNFASEEGKFDTTSWYVKAGDGVGTSEENPYLLDSVADMYGFAKRANASTDGFAGKYFKLTSSVTFNEGNPTDGEWATTAPYYVWTPIGSATANFKGHFDGGSHTISGLYVKNAASESDKKLWYVGLFGYADGAEIKNVSVKDSYFYASYYAASIVGWLQNGTLSNVYSNSTIQVASGHGGGIAGALSNATIQNAWFEGSVTGGSFVGGIVGFINDQSGRVSSCLSDGTIAGSQSGGIIGRVAGQTTIDNCLSVSNVTGGNAGALVGYHYDCELTINSSFGLKSGAKVTVNTSNEANGNPTGNAIDTSVKANSLITNREHLYDTGAYGFQQEQFGENQSLKGNKWVSRLDYTKWTARIGDIPVPAVFKVADGYQVDTSWYDVEEAGTMENPYRIEDVADFYGFAILSQRNDFKDKVISLENNLIINEDANAKNTKLYEWIPIGDRETPFAGTFLGNGYTISGLYKTFKAWERLAWIGMFEMTADTSVIRNFNIKNTYFAFTGTGDPTRIGSVAGEGYGTFDSIYSNATIKRTSGLGTGGILGVVHTSGTKANITNCWYDGEIISSQSGDAYIGGLIGFVYGGGTATVSHSLYSGSIQADAGRKIGGVTGYVNSGGTLTVTDCLITGEFSGEQQVGIVAGRVKSGTDATSTLRINTTWGVNDVVSLDVGSTENAVIEGKTHISTAKDRFIGFIPDVNSTETLALHKADGEETGFDGWVMMKDGTPVLNSFVKEGGIKTPADVYEFATVVSALNPNSNYTTWFANTPEHKGDGNYVYTIAGQSAEVYVAYCDALTSAFNLHSSNTIEDVQNRIFTAKNDDLVVDVTYSPTNTIYITVSTGKILSEHLTGAVNYSAKENAVADGYTLTGDNQLPNVTFHMVEQVEHLNGSGSSYIIQLKNGHLVVIDGGVNLQAPYLFDYMKSLVKEDEKKPVIEAWIISHPHRDHIGVFQTIWEDAYKTGEEHKGYAGQVYVNGIYFNEPSDALLTKYLYGDRGYIGYMKRAAALFKTSTNGTPDFYRMQTGQRYTFDDVTMDILLSQELLSIADYDATADVNNCVQTDAINDTSTWCMFTIGTGNNAKKLLTAGDASYSGKNYMCDMYSMNYLTMDVMTALHHGFNTNLSKYSNMDSIFQDADLQEEFSQHISVKSVVLYSYKHNMTEKEDKITYWNGVEYVHAVNRKYARLNASFIDYLASKSNSFSNGIAVSQNGNTTNRNYLYFGEGTSVLTFGNTITAELKTKISE